MKLRASPSIRVTLALEIKYDALEVNNPKALGERQQRLISQSLQLVSCSERRAFGLSMEEDGDLRDHLNHSNITQLNYFDEKFKDEDKHLLLLVSEPKKYNK